MEKRDSPDRGESGLNAPRVYSGSKAFTTGPSCLSIAVSHKSAPQFGLVTAQSKQTS